MTLISDLIPSAKALRDPETEPVLAAFALAVADPSVPVSEQFLPMVRRLQQADEKIRSGKHIAQLSELLVLAQFGGASLGALIADLCCDASLRAASQNVFTSRFLTAAVLRVSDHAHLMPTALMRRNKIGEGNLRHPAMQQVYVEVLKRSSKILSEAVVSSGHGSHTGLRRYLREQKLLTQRQVAKLTMHGPFSSKSSIGRYDRLVVSVVLLLGGNRNP